MEKRTAWYGASLLVLLNRTLVEYGEGLDRRWGIRG
jgi:hypothetical protein